MASADKRVKDKKTRLKVFLALANLKDFATAKEVAAWINKQWRGRESVAVRYVGNVLGKMREADESRHTDKLLETHGRNPYWHKLGEYTVKTAASAEMLLRINEIYKRKNFIFTAQDEIEIKAEISRKYALPLTVLTERLSKAVKGKYLKRGKDGLLRPDKRLGNEYDLLKALLEFEAAGVKQPNLNVPPAGSAPTKRSSRHTNSKRPAARRRRN